MNQEDIEQMAALMLEPMTDVQKTQWNAMQQAIVHGTGAYGLGMRQGRMIGKSTLSQRYTSLNSAPNYSPGDTAMYAFHHVRGYIKIPDAHLSDAPNHCVFLYRNQWYRKGKGVYTLKAIKVHQVPKAHRLFLMVNQVDQPME